MGQNIHRILENMSVFLFDQYYNSLFKPIEITLILVSKLHDCVFHNVHIAEMFYFATTKII